MSIFDDVKRREWSFFAHKHLDHNLGSLVFIISKSSKIFRVMLKSLCLGQVRSEWTTREIHS
jgi:hypothetical protein